MRGTRALRAVLGFCCAAFISVVGVSSIYLAVREPCWMKQAEAEEQRWSSIEAEKAAEDQKWQMKHDNGLNGKKNVSR